MRVAYSLRFLSGLLLLGGVAHAQTTGGVRIGTAGTPNASAVLDLSPDAATAPKGLLPPRLTLTQRNAIGSPATGLVVYQTDNVPGLYVYNGSIWVLQADNLGNHTATRNLNLGVNQLVGNGGNQGLSISNNGSLVTSSSVTAGQEVITDATQANTGTLSGGLRLGGSISGEGLASKRTSGGNQYGLDFYTSSSNRLSITSAGSVGIGTTAPYSQLANTPTNIVGSDSYGGSSSSLAWVSNQFGYAGMLYNASTNNAAGGLAIKTASTNAAALDVSQGISQNTAGISLLRVLANGNVGIGTTTPTYKLDVTGDAQISGSLALGLTTVSGAATVAPNTLQYIALSCPNGTRLLTGGGGYRQLAVEAIDITLRYSGPDPDRPTTTWMLYAANTGTSNRDVYITCNCARIQ